MPGQWRYVGKDPFHVRSTVAVAHDALLPDHDGRHNSAELNMEPCDPGLVLDDGAYRCLRLVFENLKELNDEGWDKWVVQVPLIPTIDKELDETNLERAIGLKLGFLEAACNRPRTDLRLDEETLDVARCKRPSAKAPMKLAAKSEDWERRTLWGIQPRRILSLVREELYDLYENRLSVALVRNLDNFLKDRIRDVGRVVRMLQQRANYQHILEGSANYRRCNRILQLWGDSDDDGRQIIHAQKALDRLKKLRKRVLGLKDSSLYQQLGSHKFSGIQLRMTNVMSNDETYREIALLWLGWEQHLAANAVDSDTQWRQEQIAVTGFESFVRLVVIRALSSIGYRPNEDSNAVRTDQWSLIGPAGSVTLVSNASGLSLRADSAKDPIRIIALPATLDGGRRIDHWISEVPEQSAIIVSLPSESIKAGSHAIRRLRSAGNEGENSQTSFVSIAPWDLESVERVARTLRWRLQSSLFEKFPFNVQLPRDWKPLHSVPEWAIIDKFTFFVVRPPAFHDARWDYLNVRLNDESSAIERLRSAIEALDPHDNRTRLRLKHELEQVLLRFELTKNVEVSLSIAIRNAQLLLECPVCQTIADANALEQTSNLFRCHCLGCNASWGLRACGACRRPIPYIDFLGNVPSSNLGNADRHYGSDILALPIDKDVFLCPHCGNASDGTHFTEGNATTEVAIPLGVA